MTYNPYWGRVPVPASKAKVESKSVDVTAPAQGTVKSQELPIAPGFGWGGGWPGAGWGWPGWGVGWGWPGWGWGRPGWGWGGWGRPGWGWGWGRPWGPWS